MEAVFILYTGTLHDYNEFDAKRFMFASPEILKVANTFKECKKYAKTLIDESHFEEILFDGTVDNNSLIFKSKDAADDKVYWVTYTPTNTLLTTFIPKEKKNLFSLYVGPLDKSYKVLIGVADSFISLQKLVTESSKINVNVKYLNKVDKDNVLLTTDQAIYWCQNISN
jgi:hypothetical protein